MRNRHFSQRVHKANIIADIYTGMICNDQNVATPCYFVMTYKDDGELYSEFVAYSHREALNAISDDDKTISQN